MFDESLNKNLQLKQVDYLVRHWRNGKIVSQYLTSQFLGHATAKDLVEATLKSIEGLDKGQIIQLSMDGPNVNWKFHTDFNQQIKNDSNVSLLNVGSCGLHKVHGAMKAAMDSSDWNLDKFLKSLHTIFNDTPARREDFEKAISPVEAIYPLKFCKHRWVENQRVGQRALQIIDIVKKYLKAVELKHCKDPGTESFRIVRKFLTDDKLLTAKLSFFVMLSSILQPFLTMYQSSKPMLPFMYEDLKALLLTLLRKFLNEKGMEAVGGGFTTLNVSDSSLHVPIHRVDIGFAAEAELSKVKKAISERQVLEFKDACKKILLKLCVDLIKKSPLQYSLVKSITCLNPLAISSSPKHVWCQNFKECLSMLVAQRGFNIHSCDSAFEQFLTFIEERTIDGSLASFNRNGPLDEFWFRITINSDKNLAWEAVSQLLLLSHGQADVERGFSVNKETSEINLAERSLIARRSICDHISNIGGIQNFVICQKLMSSCSSAYQNYKLYLEAKKKEKSETELSRKRKLLEEEVICLKKRKMAIERDIQSLNETADEYLLEADKKKDLTFVTKSLSLKRTAKEKTEELKNVEKKIQEK
ncbi:Protein FAM135B, partial [Biomphalaria glabrata]